jgi:hypothetical protein
MATKVVVCPECESALEPGRFSCSTCGALVAAIASVPRSFAPVPEPTPPAVQPVPVEQAPPPEMFAPATADAAPLEDDGWDPPDAEPDAQPEPAVAAAAAVAPEAPSGPLTAAAPDVLTAPEIAPAPMTYQPAPPAQSWPDPAPPAQSWPVPAPAPMPAASVAPPPVAAAPAWPTPTPTTAAGWQDDGQFAQAAQAAPPPAPTAWQQPTAWPPASAAPVAPEPPVRTPAGAYLPPSAVLPPGEALPVPGKNGTASGPTAAATAPAPRTLAERFALGDADGPLGLPKNAPGRTIALGAAIAGLGFLLPWAEIVIGTTSVGGFLDMWGLAGPGHPIILLLLIVVGFLAVAHEKWPVRVGAGTASIVLGSVMLGLAFPYVMGPFREAVGVYVTAAGAIVMIVGGLLARVPPRHADAEASV